VQVTVMSSKVRILPQGKQAWVLNCKEVPNREAAEQLTGHRIIIPIAQREQLKVCVHVNVN
jgi:ribosomal 30S subunit maturation factor RimM